MTDVYIDTLVILQICVGKAPDCAAVCSVSAVSTVKISHNYHNITNPVKIILFSEICFFHFLQAFLN